jgi:hypothetical protein
MDITLRRGTARRLAGRGLPLAAIALVAVSAAGCSSSGGNSASAASGGQFAAGNTGNGDALSPSAPRAAFSRAEAQDSSVVEQRAVISTGRVVLSSSDVAAARTRVDAVLLREGGQVADEDTVTDRSGTVTSSHLVVRVPSDHFGAAMKELEGVATLRSSSRKAEDVTTQVLDTGARIEAQRAGVKRLRQLVTSAGDLRALLAVERELSARQGQLQSLLRQRAYLADQTSLATISVDISAKVAPPPPAQEARGGFVGGLHRGWHALVATGTGVLVVVGTLLPFAIVVALVGIPAWLVVRRLRRPEPEPEAPAEA